MKINTITCHDVYNVGASLQAYALVKYLNNLGYDTEIIDYKPPYLEHYKLTGVDNPAYDRPIFRQAYQILKFPMRLVNRLSKRKKVFDNFTKKYLPRTERKYTSMVELRENLPYADLYIAGSDQIWNPLFRNGKDPAFFLNFAPDNSRKISYAASFAVDDISEEDRNRMEQWLKRLDAISVRETSGVALLRSMNLQGTQVCDPVFLLDDLEWKQLAVYPKEVRYLFVYDFDNNEQLQLIARKLAKKGNSIVYVVQDKEIIALIGVNDIIRKNAKEVIEKLNKNKIDTIMLTGDNKETAETIAKEIGIGKVIANVVPSEKTQVIKELKKQSKNVMMCGDGINDSPALATADIGVSVKSGTDIAMDSSDVILTRNNLDCILTLIHISKSTMKIIKQNLFWAFFYNILMIPIAIGILKPVGIVINPMIASLAMVISSLTVILNTLRLRKK